MSRCADCEWVVFPSRPICPRCDGVTFREVTARYGLVAQVTRAGGVLLASVCSDLGPVVIASLSGTEVHKGEKVSLASERPPGGSGTAFVAVPERGKDSA